VYVDEHPLDEEVDPEQPLNRSRKNPLNWVASGAEVIAVTSTRLYIAVPVRSRVIYTDCVVKINGRSKVVKMT
jgi:hypothetical protein